MLKFTMLSVQNMVKISVLKKDVPSRKIWWEKRGKQENMMNLTH